MESGNNFTVVFLTIIYHKLNIFALLSLSNSRTVNYVDSVNVVSSVISVRRCENFIFD